MRLLVFGHLSHTGFGRVTQELGERFVAAGIDVRVIAVNHRGEPVHGPLSGRVWPAAIQGDGFGGNISSGAIDGTFWKSLDREDVWAPDQVLVVSDMSGLSGHIGRMTPAWASLPVWHYCPIEGDNLNPSWRDIWNDPAGNGSRSFLPVAMSEYGRRIIEGHLGRAVPMIYHGVDTEAFHPVSASDPIEFEGKVLRTKEQCKAAFGLDPTRKMILRYDRLVQRKFYDIYVRVLTDVLGAEPDTDAVIHCRPVDDGLNLYEDLARMPDAIIKTGRVKLTLAHDTWKGLSDAGLVALINAADVMVSTTSGEGFGLTIAESLACGVPVVVTDWAAEAEVVGPGGITVPPLHDAYGEVVRYHASYGMDWAVPDGRAFVEPIRTLLAKPQRRRALGDAGRAHVKRSFSWAECADQFIDLFASAVPVEVAA